MSGSSAIATEWFYNDLKSTSSNGRYVAEAKSPDNAEDRHLPFAGHFTITLSEAGSAEPLWSHVQQEDEDAPIVLFPADDGRLIVEDTGSQYAVFDTTGKRTVVLRVIASLSDDEVKRFVSRTSAGDWWGQFATHEFMTVGSRPVFFIRTYWGRVFAIDYQSARWLRDPELERDIEARVVADTRAWLTTFSGDLKPADSRGGKGHYSSEVGMRLCVVRLHGISEGLPYVDQVIAEPDHEHWPDLARELSRVPAGRDEGLPEAAREIGRTTEENQVVTPAWTPWEILGILVGSGGASVGLVMLLFLRWRGR